ncbi:MAG: hypothetical protein AB1330_01630 [Bacillota bacterium]
MSDPDFVVEVEMDAGVSDPPGTFWSQEEPCEDALGEMCSIVRCRFWVRASSPEEAVIRALRYFAPGDKKKIYCISVFYDNSVREFRQHEFPWSLFWDEGAE